MKILIPMDGSEHALRALRQVLDRRAWFSEPPEFHLLNVQLPIASGGVKMFIHADQLREYYEDEGRVALKAAREVVEAAGVPFHARVAVGDVARTIVQYATEQGCSLIAMGTRGMGAAGHALLGSVASKVVHHAHIPVLLIN